MTFNVYFFNNTWSEYSAAHRQKHSVYPSFCLKEKKCHILVSGSVLRWTGSNKVNFSSPEMRALFILCNFDRTPANFLIIFLSLLVAQPNITWPFPVISRNNEYIPDRSSGHTSVRFFVPRGKSQTAQLWGLLYFLLRVVRVPPHHQGSFLAVSVPLHLDQLPFPSLIFPFRVSSHLLWAGEKTTKAYQTLGPKSENMGSEWRRAGFSLEFRVLNLCHLFWLFGGILFLVWVSLCILPSGGYSVMLWLTIRMSRQELYSFFFFLKLVFILLRYTH